MFENFIEEITSIYSKERSLVKSNFLKEKLAILKHLNFVAEELEKLKAELEIVEIESEEKAVVSCLSDIKTEDKAAEYKNTIKYLKKLSNRLFWRYGYQNPSQEMAEKYAYTEIIGPEGPIYSEELIVGFVLLAPGFYYPKHRHSQIEETYLFLSGKTIYNQQAILGEGAFVLNEAGRVHELKSAGEEPTLILYSWLKKGEGSLKDYQLNLD